MSQRHDDDVTRVLQDDGVGTIEISRYENRPATSIEELKAELGDGSWAARLAYNELFGGVAIRQLPGEGNRLHLHPDADECWVIMEGEWEWYIEGEGVKRVGPGHVVVVRKGTPHRITCVGDEPGIRFAVTRPDVNHVYAGD
jgi:mannose-6-phosphate isomerase-like protein (cupin superfamily)